jgi:hypothetical protein
MAEDAMGEEGGSAPVSSVARFCLFWFLAISQASPSPISLAQQRRNNKLWVALLGLDGAPGWASNLLRPDRDNYSPG